MSIFASQTTWPEAYKACGAPDQSPINLSQSFALPCDLLCQFEMDEVAVPDAQVALDDNGVLMLTFNEVRPTAKFKGDGYTAYYAKFFNPSQHTIEGVQAQGEFVVYYSNPSGKSLAVSVLVRTTPSGSASSSFFSSFIPFATSVSSTNIGLGSGWMLQSMMPQEPSFYMYTGTDVVPGCDPMTWLVFSNTVNMDPSDFAKLGTISPAGSRNLQPVGDRDVFFNDTTLPSGTSMPHDNKVYLRCRGGGKTGAGKPGGSSSGGGGSGGLLGSTEPAGLAKKDAAETKESTKLAASNTGTSVQGWFKENWSLVMVGVVAIGVLYIAFYTTLLSSFSDLILSAFLWLPGKIQQVLWKGGAGNLASKMAQQAIARKLATHTPSLVK